MPALARSSRSDLAYSHTALTVRDRARLSELISEWQLVSDLSFADLILWVPRRKDYQSWPEGHIARVRAASIVKMQRAKQRTLLDLD